MMPLTMASAELPIKRREFTERARSAVDRRGFNRNDFPRSNEYFERFRLTERHTEAGIVKMAQVLESNVESASMKRSEVLLFRKRVLIIARYPDLAAITFLYDESKKTQ